MQRNIAATVGHLMEDAKLIRKDVDAMGLDALDDVFEVLEAKRDAASELARMMLYEAYRVESGK